MFFCVIQYKEKKHAEVKINYKHYLHMLLKPGEKGISSASDQEAESTTHGGL